MNEYTNTVTVERDTFTIIISENEASCDELVAGFRNALLGLGFSPISVNESMGPEY